MWSLSKPTIQPEIPRLRTEIDEDQKKKKNIATSFTWAMLFLVISTVRGMPSIDMIQPGCVRRDVNKLQQTHLYTKP